MTTRSTRDFLKKTYAGLTFAHKLGAGIAGVFMAVMMLAITVDVAGRNFDIILVSYSYEWTEYYFMAFAFFPALGYIYSSGIMPRVNSLYDRMRDGPRTMVAVLFLLTEIVVFGLLFMWTIDEFVHAFSESTTFSVGYEQQLFWPVKLVVPAGICLLLLDRLFVLSENLIYRNGTLVAAELLRSRSGS